MNSYRYLPIGEVIDVSKKGKVQTWSFAGQLRTVRRGREYFKVAFASEFELARLVAESHAAGIKGIPSSWGDVYHRLYPRLGPSKSVLHAFAGRIYAGWQEAVLRGALTGTWYVYDIVSAYAWAAMQGLPDCKSARKTEKIRKDGFYYGTFSEATEKAAPPNLRSGRRPTLFSGEEADAYCLKGVQILRGIRFTKQTSIEPNMEFIRGKFTDWKKIFRGFWGCWISQQPVICQVLEDGHATKTWQATRQTYNPAWGHCLLSRVRQRVSEHARQAARIYIDSVTIPYEIPTGSGIGDWKLDRVIEAPLEILGAGQVKVDGQWLKRSGFKKEYVGG